MAMGRSWDHLHEMVGLLSDPDVLLSIGLLSFHNGSAECEFADPCASRVVGSLIDFVREMLAEEITFSRSYSEDLPNKFVPLVSEDAEVVKETAMWIWTAFIAVSKLEEQGLHDPWVRQFVRNLLWPLNGWVREVCIAIGEMEASKLPPDIHREVLDYSLGWGTTVPNENSFNRCRKVMKTTPAGRMGGQSIWHACLKSPILQENDVQTIKAEKVDEIMSAGRHSDFAVSKASFTGSAKRDFTLGENKLIEYKEGGGRGHRLRQRGTCRGRRHWLLWWPAMAKPHGCTTCGRAGWLSQATSCTSGPAEEETSVAGGCFGPQTSEYSVGQLW